MSFQVYIVVILNKYAPWDFFVGLSNRRNKSGFCDTRSADQIIDLRVYLHKANMVFSKLRPSKDGVQIKSFMRCSKEELPNVTSSVRLEDIESSLRLRSVNYNDCYFL